MSVCVCLYALKGTINISRVSLINHTHCFRLLLDSSSPLRIQPKLGFLTLPNSPKQAEYKKGQEEERARQRELEDNYNSYKGLFHKTSPTAAKAEQLNEEEEKGPNYTYAEDGAHMTRCPRRRWTLTSTMRLARTPSSMGIDDPCTG